MGTFLTTGDIRRATAPIRVADLYILPPQPSQAEIILALDAALRMPSVPLALRTSTQHLKEGLLLALPHWQFAYETFVDTERFDPPWFASLPTVLQRFLKLQRAFGGETEEGDTCHVFPSLPRAGYGYIVLEDGLCEATASTFSLGRLMEIRQLGFLHDPMVAETEMKGMTWRFPHTRYTHVFDVMSVMTLMGTNNGLSPRQLNNARVAALTHDTLTPAGGDTTKMIDPKAFDEDLHYPELLAKTDWSALRERFDLDGTLLKNTILNRGLLGQLLDYADKIAYVSRDADMFLSRLGVADDSQEYAAMVDYLRAHPDICSVWDAVRVTGEEVWVDDPDRLLEFLRLRVMLFRWLYFHPGARFMEFVLIGTACRYLYETGRITRDWLLEHTDNDLDRVMIDFTGIHLDLIGSDQIGDPRVETFDTVEAAKAREAELIRQGVPLTLVEDLGGKIKPATHFRVKHRRKLLPYRQVFTREAEELHALAQMPDPVRLYYVLEPRLKPNCLEALLNFRRHNAH